MPVLPPLNALRAFEAAARQLSFTRAAEELHVTQAAVSHQIKSLEERLGVTLFRRVGRGLRLTDAAQAYLGEVRGAFARIAEATRRLQALDAGGALNASVLPSFAAKWLLPRLGRFQAAHPEIDLRISAVSEMTDFARDDIDIGIRTGLGAWPGLRADLILTEELFIVCSPKLLDQRPLDRPEDLRHHMLLHDEPRERWMVWLRRAGIDDIDPWRGLGFSQSNLVIQAAIEGHGVAIVGGQLVADDLRAGRLVRPLLGSTPTDYSYWLVCPEAAAARPKIVAFRNWILAEAAASGAT
jgi:LysR family transcriptional regulator, glycine cleavage system transcriptional activator